MYTQQANYWTSALEEDMLKTGKFFEEDMLKN